MSKNDVSTIFVPPLFMQSGADEGEIKVHPVVVVVYFLLEDKQMTLRGREGEHSGKQKAQKEEEQRESEGEVDTEC